MGPFIRIGLRYGVGAVIGYEMGAQLADDPDVIAVVSTIAAAAVGVATEWAYALARKWGWRT